MTVRPIEEGGFRFLPTGEGYQVYHRASFLGEIISMRERTGRPCFRLGLDTRSAPKTFRGRVRAATVLKAVKDLRRSAQRRKWPMELLILAAREIDLELRTP